MTRRHKQTLARILVAGILLIAAVLTPQAWGLWRLPIFLIPYFVVGWDVLWEAICNIAHGEIFDENFLMCVATLGALVLGEYAEAVGVMLFYQVGELFQSLAVNKSRRSIAQLMDIRPDSAHVLRQGKEVTVDPDEVQVGETLVVRPGERIALDGVVVEGSSSLDTAALTGESMPRDVEEGQEVSSGCVNLTGLLHLEVTRPFGQSTVARILELVENAAGVLSPAQLEVLTQLQLCRHLHQTVLAHQCRPGSGELSLIQLLVGPVQVVGHHHPQNGIPQEFQHFAVLAAFVFQAVTLSGERLVEERLVGKTVPDDLLDPFHIFHTQHKHTSPFIIAN